MQTNYKFKHGISLVLDGMELDLQNIYNFAGLEYSIEQRTLKLIWQRGFGEWARVTRPSRVEIEFAGISLFEFRPRNTEMPFTGDDCLRHAGRVCEDIFISDPKSDPDWKTAFCFMSGAVIALKAETATARVHD